MNATIKAIASYLPPKQLSNQQLAAECDQASPESLYRISGVRQRHIAEADVTPSDLAFCAAETLFERHPASRQQIDALLFCTEGLDYKVPVTACLLHQRLGLPSHCLSLDVPGGCTGFVNGLAVANSLIASGAARHVLLLTAETVSKVLHDEDIHLRAIFGDGACASLISQHAQSHIGQFVSGTDGRGKEALWVERSGTRQPADIDWLTQYRHTSQGMQYGRLRMQGDKLLHFALTHVPTLIDATLAANQLQHDDIDLFVFHQASRIILTSLKRKCRLPDHKFMLHLENVGNTVSSSIPLALEAALQSGRVGKGKKVMLVGFGVGFSWGATVVTL